METCRQEYEPAFCVDKVLGRTSEKYAWKVSILPPWIRGKCNPRQVRRKNKKYMDFDS
jgi:hypothetical protein